ncbi:hypothetical protein BRN33_18955 [Xanthomonas oryzae pv. oryzae]|uniref:hypothetical protein n=1 Tax=Xanthomonas oryzae TaxID=347 RepID=UPI000949D3F1|nr:hypothetical protein [Xanthomonas oryzae]AXM13737.1 hypothetical protein BRN32_13215 [Xanthomonas oryzae pv. oryzae]OLH91781.1 hypothetical protein DXO216_05345 [Xanthomonas oryzae pv. oryzae]OLK05705.1 hypothetical protein IXO599_13345 [Xanthomonas oryzae pv. oryzae]RBH93905.1 hypothetical protein BRL93_04810 [Xanthomonas oryzae pv. oryzae]RBL08366.1 hypothetical protein BRN33_18955 [Xanthomonas oryzae pv. oryzae]
MSLPEHPSVLRLYFAAGTRARPSRFLHRLGAPALARHLLHAARRSGIAQAVLLHVDSGYLAGQARMFHHHPELAHMRHRQCLELIDSQAHLHGFLDAHRDELRDVRAVLLCCCEIR